MVDEEVGGVGCVGDTGIFDVGSPELCDVRENDVIGKHNRVGTKQARRAEVSSVLLEHWHETNG